MNTLCRFMTQNASQSGYCIFSIAGKNGPAAIVLNTYKSGGCLSYGSCLPQWNCQRYSHTFLSRVTAEQLWKGVTSVSPAGKRKGRGRRSGRRLMQDLNKGQVIGFGKKNMVWPGLNAPVIRGKEIVTQQELPPDEERQARILQMRDQITKVPRFLKLTPLERGFSGNKLPGRSIGPPDPIGEETFEGFDSRVLQFRSVMTMSGQRGRVRSFNALVVVGNKKGLAGFATSTSPNGMTAAKNARNRAAQNLRFIEIDKGHTVLHDFHSSFGAVNIFVNKRPAGFGLMCHRVVRAICEMIGIKDLYAKCEGPTDNIQNVTKAFFIGLMKQKLPQQIAEEKGLHLIEFRQERDNFPEVVASPLRCRTKEEIGIHEITNFRLHMLNGRVIEKRLPYVPFYHKFDCYIKEMKDREMLRNQRDVHIHLRMKYDALKSFLTVREEEKAKQAVKDAIEEK